MSTPPLAHKKLTDRYETGVAMLVLVWTTAVIVHHDLAARGTLTTNLDAALTSLIYVVPLMLLGWGLMELADRIL